MRDIYLDPDAHVDRFRMFFF